MWDLLGQLLGGGGDRRDRDRPRRPKPTPDRPESSSAKRSGRHESDGGPHRPKDEHARRDAPRPNREREYDRDRHAKKSDRAEGPTRPPRSADARSDGDDNRRAARRDEVDRPTPRRPRDGREPAQDRGIRRRELNENGNGNGNGHAANGDDRPRMSGARAIAFARQAALDMTGEEPEGVSGLQVVDGHWHVVLDVVELRRVPRTTDVMATYEMELDESGELVSYRRLSRYYRSQVDQG